MKRYAGMLILFLALSGCGGQELYSQLSEREANEMVAMLLNAGLPAEKVVLEKETFAVTTSSRFFAQAIGILHANGYPRERFENLGDVFKKEGFVSSPLEERARLVHALSQEIANTIASIDGVVMARVHLAVPEKDPLSDNAKPSSASVFIKHRRSVDLSNSVSQIKALVVNGVEGVPYDSVTVALFATEPRAAPRNPVAGVAGSTVAGITTGPQFVMGLVGGTALLGGVWLWRRRKRGGLPLSVEERARDSRS